jgi:iron-sulfur cluster assembly protein
MSIHLTEKSAAVLRDAMEQEPQPPEFVRFGIKAGGCSGFTYTIDFTNTKHPAHDLVYHTQGLSLLVDKKSYLYVRGTTIDWSDDLNNKGFLFSNPLAKGACGCRTSFVVDLKNLTQPPTPTWMA